jgi:hypothetical protein
MEERKSSGLRAKITNANRKSAASEVFAVIYVSWLLGNAFIHNRINNITRSLFVLCGDSMSRARE